MFGSKWRIIIKEMMEDLAGKVASTETKVEQMADQTLPELVSHAGSRIEALDEIEKKINELSTSITNHDMAIEDLLDEWTAIQENKKRQEESEEKQKNLLELITLYDSHIRLLRSSMQAGGDDKWEYQVGMIQKVVSQGMEKCGIAVLGLPGETVNYELHEVLQAEQTDDPQKHGHISQVLDYGYIADGVVIKKAKVSAWRYPGLQRGC